MTIAQQQTYYRQYLRWHRSEERIAYRLVLVRLDRMQQHLEQLLRTYGAETLLGMLPMVITQGEFSKLLANIYTTTGVRAAERQYTRLAGRVKYSPVAILTKDRGYNELTAKPQPIHPKEAGWRARLVELVTSSTTLDRVKGMAAKTISLVTDVLTGAIVQKLSVDTIVGKLREKVVDKARALLIARTETTLAANAGHEAGAVSTGLKLFKKWVAILDDRTRFDHAEMNRKPAIRADRLFDVGGRSMRYPGDPSGGAKNVCRCRCIVIYDLQSNLLN